MQHLCVHDSYIYNQNISIFDQATARKNEKRYDATLIRTPSVFLRSHHFASLSRHTRTQDVLVRLLYVHHSHIRKRIIFFHHMSYENAKCSDATLIRASLYIGDRIISILNYATEQHTRMQNERMRPLYEHHTYFHDRIILILDHTAHMNAKRFDATLKRAPFLYPRSHHFDF